MLYTSCSQAGKRARRLWALVLAASLTASAAHGGRMPSAVRSLDAFVNELLIDGYARSATFRQLVDAIAESNIVVYVGPGICAFGHLKGCLLPFLGGTGQVHYLRIVLTRPLRPTARNQLIAIVGHELQHAVEVAGQPDIVDVDGMLELYRRIGIPMESRPGYETSAARAAGDAVLNELEWPVAPCPLHEC
jgi:hypothetical protein